MIRFRLYKICIGFIAVFIICIQPVTAEEPIYGQYTTPEGIQIISYLPEWQGAILPEIELELKRNIHGIEMEYLDRIEIHQGLEPGRDTHIAATYQRENGQIDIPINLSGFLPDDFSIPVSLQKGVIKIYQAEEKEGVEQISMELSHEYGHHFTFFHFGDQFSSSSHFKESDYYMVRQLSDYDMVNGKSSYDPEIHRWSIFEIAAEDYRLLMGSSTHKRVTLFEDISQKAGSKTYQPINGVTHRDYNAIPQENWEIPLAFEVEGLREYFYSFIDDVYVYPYEDVEMLSPKILHRVEYNHDFRKVIFEWDPFIGEESVIYTLIAYSEDYSKVMPVKTIHPNEELRAVIGTVTVKEGQYIYYYKDGLDQGLVHFVLYTKFMDGYILVSEPLVINFES